MHIIILFGLVGVAVGALLGYFFAAPMLLLFSLLVCFIYWYPIWEDERLVREGKRGNTSGLLGFILVGYFFVIGFLLGVWGMWIFFSWEFITGNAGTLWENLSPHIFRLR